MTVADEQRKLRSQLKGLYTRLQTVRNVTSSVQGTPPEVTERLDRLQEQIDALVELVLFPNGRWPEGDDDEVD